MANTSLYVVAAVLVLGYLLLGGNNDGGSSLDFGNELSVSRGGESQDLEYGDDLEAETEGDGEQGSDTSMIGTPSWQVWLHCSLVAGSLRARAAQRPSTVGGLQTRWLRGDCPGLYFHPLCIR
eukprot:scaffold451_cov365-Prasinococcus_capsulatus_cf.AAC.19